MALLDRAGISTMSILMNRNLRRTQDKCVLSVRVPTNDYKTLVEWSHKLNVPLSDLVMYLVSNMSNRYYLDLCEV